MILARCASGSLGTELSLRCSTWVDASRFVRLARSSRSAGTHRMTCASNPTLEFETQCSFELVAGFPNSLHWLRHVHSMRRSALIVAAMAVSRDSLPRSTMLSATVELLAGSPQPIPTASAPANVGNQCGAGILARSPRPPAWSRCRSVAPVRASSPWTWARDTTRSPSSCGSPRDRG
jgi:hypothetical protein